MLRLLYVVWVACSSAGGSPHWHAQQQRIRCSTPSYSNSLLLLLPLLPQGIDLDAGALVYECPGIKLDPKNIGIGGQDLTPDEPDPLASQAFQLSSRSSAGRKVFLDFEGGAVKNTAWNKAYPNINIPAFDMDGKPGEFSVAERNAIVAVWRSVSEDYRCAERLLL
jgi:hypothetical protein